MGVKHRLSTWKRDLLYKLRQERPNTRVEYILPPKTGTTSVCRLLKTLKNTGRGHKLLGPISHQHNRRAVPGRISFMTIREPVSRMNSFMHWKRRGHRLALRTLRNRGAVRRLMGNFPLNRVVGVMTCRELRNVVPDHHHSCMQVDFMKNIDVCLTIEEVPEALSILLKLDSIPELPHANKTKKINANLSGKQAERVRRIYKQDLELYKHWTRPDE